jgi:hypothetical protein
VPMRHGGRTDQWRRKRPKRDPEPTMNWSVLLGSGWDVVDVPQYVLLVWLGMLDSAGQTRGFQKPGRRRWSRPSTAQPDLAVGCDIHVGREEDGERWSGRRVIFSFPAISGPLALDRVDAQGRSCAQGCRLWCRGCPWACEDGEGEVVRFGRHGQRLAGPTTALPASRQAERSRRLHRGPAAEAAAKLRCFLRPGF